MSVIVSHQGGRLLCTKGAPDVLLDACTYIMWDGNVVPLTATLRQKVLAANEGMASDELRVLGLAYRDLRSYDKPETEKEAESQLIFVGLAGMIDPPRREVREAIATCRRAGIKTVMITGDHRTTAEAIAAQLGILPRNGLSLSGQELSRMDDKELDASGSDLCLCPRIP